MECIKQINITREDMTVKKLIEELSYYNPNAIVTVGDNLYNGISLSISGGDGCTKLDCDFVCFDKVNKQENNESAPL